MRDVGFRLSSVTFGEKKKKFIRAKTRLEKLIEEKRQIPHREEFQIIYLNTLPSKRWRVIP